MILFQQAATLSHHLIQQKATGVKVGFVPTMGALHQGHLSLLELCKIESDLTVCSIFVNPTQFNNPDDFKHYPITIEKDIELLASAGCDVLFLPSKEEIYPPGYQAKQYALGTLEQVLEGYYRPGHFQGVCQVVDRLLEIVQPARLYVGQKDYQQCQVIQKLIALTERTKDVQLIIGPTVREADGLAMSSRNLRLTPAQRQQAPALYQALALIQENFTKKSIEALILEAKNRMERAGFTIDYLEVADAVTLQPSVDKGRPLVALVAAYLDSVRLIDNLPLN